MRAVRASAAAVLAAVAVAGCGGGIPTDASVKDFCAAGERFAEVTEFDEGTEAAERLRETGTPEGIPKEARDGFEEVVTLVTGSKDTEDLQQRYDKLSDTQQKSVEALDTYIEKTC